MYYYFLIFKFANATTVSQTEFKVFSYNFPENLHWTKPEKSQQIFCQFSC